MNKRNPQVGDVCRVDNGPETVVVEATAMYAGRRPNVKWGCSVRPIGGGRARVVANNRLTIIEPDAV